MNTHWRLLTILRISAKAYEVMLFDKSSIYTLGQEKRYKNALSFLLWVRTYQYLTFNSLYLRWSTRFVSLKACVKFSISDSVSFLLMLTFFASQETWGMDSFRHNCFQNWNIRKVTHDFTPKPLIFKFQQELLKFNNICLSWSLLQVKQETNFSN